MISLLRRCSSSIVKRGTFEAARRLSVAADCVVGKQNTHAAPKMLASSYISHYGLKCFKSAGFVRYAAMQFTQRRTYRGVKMYTACWQLQRTVIHCNENRFHEKPEGISYSVQYIDTAANMAPEVRVDFPVILGIPACPGTHKDLMDLMRPFVTEGMRVVIMNCPGSEYVRSGKMLGEAFKPDHDESPFFTQTVAERTLFTIQLLAALGIEQIDLAVAHSNAASPLLLFMNAGPMVKAGMFINATPVQRSGKLARPAWMTKLIMMADPTPGFGRVFLDRMSSILFKGAGLRNYSPNERLAGIQAAVGASNAIMVETARVFADKSEIPFSFVYTAKDPLIRVKDFADYASLLGITREDTILMKPGIDVVSVDSRAKRRAMVFNMASHYPHYNATVKQYIRNECIHLLAQSMSSEMDQSISADVPVTPDTAVSQ